MTLSELKERTIEELNEEVVSLRKQLLELRMAKAMHKLEDTSRIAKTKTKIAQVKTIIRQKQLAK